MSGLNKRREMERMEKKKDDRRKENLAALGMDTRARRKAQGAEAALRRACGAGAQSPSSTAPRLALDAFFANLASTPRV